MKPITDEVILSLVERADRRQKNLKVTKATALGRQIKKERFRRGRLISLDIVRRQPLMHQTISGVYCYAPRT